MIEFRFGQSHGAMTRPILAFVVLVAACKSEAPAASASTPAPTVYEPKLSAELVAPAAKGLVLGVATDEDVVKAFGAGETKKDKSIGGAIVVQYNDKPAMHIDLPAKDDVLKGEAWLVPDGDGKPRLQLLSLTLKAGEACKWIETNVGKHEASKNRPGSNRKYGKDGNGFELTAGTTDGTAPVSIACHGGNRDGVAIENLEYSVESERGRSMMMNENP